MTKPTDAQLSESTKTEEISNSVSQHAKRRALVVRKILSCGGAMSDQPTAKTASKELSPICDHRFFDYCGKKRCHFCDGIQPTSNTDNDAYQTRAGSAASNCNTEDGSKSRDDAYVKFINDNAHRSLGGIRDLFNHGYDSRDEEVKLLKLGTETDRQRMTQHGLRISELEQENKRMRETLQFYGALMLFL